MPGSQDLNQFLRPELLLVIPEEQSLLQSKAIVY